MKNNFFESIGFFSLAFLMASINISVAQSLLVKQWDYRFGGTGADELHSFQQTSDGGYILGGFSYSAASGDKTQNTVGNYDYWIVKIDALGNMQWNKDFGGTDFDALYSVQQTSDGGYILGGYSSSGIGGDKTQPLIGGNGDVDYWIVKVDASGNKQWDKDFGGTDYDALYSVQQTSDGGYILGGYSSSGIGGDKTQNTIGYFDYWIVKIDALGNEQWDKDFGGTDFDVLYSVQQTSDGGYILGGYSSSGIGGDKTQNTIGYYDYWVVKTDALGNKQWDKDFGGTDYDELYSVQQTTDGGYILGGCSFSGIGGDKTQNTQGSADYWIIKTDALGNKQWDKDFGGSYEEDRFGYVKQTSDGGYLVSGISRSNISGDKTEDNIGFKNAWVVKTDPAGNKQWDKTALTSPDNKIEAYAIQSFDGCYEIARPSYAAIAGNKTQDNWDNTHTTPDYWIVKFCDSTYSVPVAASFVGNTFLCPGTCTGFLNLSINATNYLWSFPGGNPSVSIDVNPASICYPNPGTYDIQLIATNATSVDTLILTDYITVYPYPLPQAITQNGDTLIANTGATSYQWFYNGNILNGATDYFYVASVSGDYNVVATDTNNCEVEAVLYNVIAGVDAVSMQDPFQIISNPVIDKLIIERNTTRSDEVRIYNVFGQEIYAATENKKSFTVNCGNFTSGLYFIRVGKAIVRFIKE